MQLLLSPAKRLVWRVLATFLSRGARPSAQLVVSLFQNQKQVSWKSRIFRSAPLIHSTSNSISSRSINASHNAHGEPLPPLPAQARGPMKCGNRPAARLRMRQLRRVACLSASISTSLSERAMAAEHKRRYLQVWQVAPSSPGSAGETNTLTHSQGGVAGVNSRAQGWASHVCDRRRGGHVICCP
jgi:hypothetical protein